VEKSFFLIYIAYSKLKFKRQLDRTRSADLIKWVKPAIGPTRPQAICQRLRRAAEQGTGYVVVGIAEVWVVKDVEELRSETKPHFLGDVKLPLQGNIRLPGSETTQNIAPKIPLLPNGRGEKRRSIENLAAGILGSL
jgi:hypothetical protein